MHVTIPTVTNSSELIDFIELVVASHLLKSKKTPSARKGQGKGLMDADFLKTDLTGETEFELPKWVRKEFLKQKKYLRKIF